MKNILITIMVLITVSSTAQRTCHSDIKMQERMNADPTFAAHHEEVMRQLYNPENVRYENRGANGVTAVVTIPVVFHILYKNATQNISDAQILSQLAVLNADFRKLNTDFNAVVPIPFRSFGADLEIQFAKATQTPAGVATTGITRKSVPSTFVFEDNYYEAAGQPAWNTLKYLNIWIGRFTDDTLLGFAYPPTAAGLNFDGLCIGDQFFGTTGTATAPFNKGRTGTHEIGHYFGLKHPWGINNSVCGTTANNDGAADTPSKNGPTYSCPTFPNNAESCTVTTNGTMFMNYMDYVNDACMAFFTTNQKTITQTALNGSRVGLLTSMGANPLGTNSFEFGSSIVIFPNPTSDVIKISSPKVGIDNVEIYNAIGQLVKTQTLTSAENSVSIVDLSSGIYTIKISYEGTILKASKIIKN